MKVFLVGLLDSPEDESHRNCFCIKRLQNVFPSKLEETLQKSVDESQTVSIQLPIVLTKFFESVQLERTEFFERWKLIGGPPREAQTVFPIVLDSAGELDLSRYRQALLGSKLNVLEGVDPNPNNLVAAGVLHMSVDGKVGCLLRMEPNKEAKVHIPPSYLPLQLMTSFL